MANVDIVIVPIEIKDGKDTNNAAEQLSALRREGWEWAVGAGGTGKLHRDIAGFVILERPKPQ